jgi:hypothetical protein
MRKEFLTPVTVLVLEMLQSSSISINKYGHLNIWTPEVLEKRKRLEDQCKVHRKVQRACFKEHGS